jgi:dTDP-4-dehydrorhamnose 3,5-epimerase
VKLIETAIPGVVIVEPAVFRDERGWFMETFNEPRFHSELVRLGLPAPRPFVQDNHSCSRAGVLRGLHFQVPPHPQGKLVRVTRGSAWDVAVDIRPESPTFGRWFGTELSDDNCRQLWIPEGFAHGFLALQDDTHFLYKTTDVYAKDCERSIVWNDTMLAIDWPLDSISGQPELTAKDAAAPQFQDLFSASPPLQKAI